MDYLGHSILSLQSSDPATLAAIVALQAEVAVVEGDAKTQAGELTTLRERVTALDGAVKTLQEDAKKKTEAMWPSCRHKWPHWAVPYKPYRTPLASLTVDPL